MRDGLLQPSSLYILIGTQKTNHPHTQTQQGSRPAATTPCGSPASSRRWGPPSDMPWPSGWRGVRCVFACVVLHMRDMMCRTLCIWIWKRLVR